MLVKGAPVQFVQPIIIDARLGKHILFSEFPKNESI